MSGTEPASNVKLDEPVDAASQIALPAASTSVDKRLDTEFVRNELLKIFIEKQKEGDNYTSMVSGDLFGDTIIDIQNNGTTCVFLELPTFENGQYCIGIGLINKCQSYRASGTTNILNIISFCKKYEYNILRLYNSSELKFKFIDETFWNFNLTMIKILEIGNTWYSQFGFNNKYTTSGEPMIKSIIKTNFKNLIFQYERLVDSIEKNESNKRTLKDEIQMNLNMFIKKLNRNGFEVNLEMPINIFMKKTIQKLFDVCKDGICPGDFKMETMKEIQDFILFLNSIVFSIIFKRLINTEESRQLIQHYYSSLELDLGSIHLSRGGKYIKSKKSIYKKSSYKKSSYKKSKKNYKKSKKTYKKSKKTYKKSKKTKCKSSRKCKK